MGNNHLVGVHELDGVDLVRRMQNTRELGKSAEWNCESEQATHQLNHVSLGLVFGQPLFALDELKHGLVGAQLHEDVNEILVLEYILEAHNVLVRERLVNLDFALELPRFATSIATSSAEL